MPKYLLGNIIVKTFEVWADSKEDAEKFVLSFQESDSEEPEGGIKATRYALGWDEVSTESCVPKRDQVLQEVLKLMQETIPGMPPPGEIDPEKYEGSLIIHPFKK